MDPVWGYEAVNVEAQQSDPSSLLSWMRNMIALRKLFRVFGRGTLEFLNPSNRKVLAYLRRDGEEQILCVANLSRFAQPVDLDLPDLEGLIPIEMLGYVEFPAIGRQPYRLTLGPYGFLWLELHGQPEAAEKRTDLAPLEAESWESVLEGAGRYWLETALLPEFLPKQRWFGGKARRIRSTRIVDWAALADSNAVVVVVEVDYERGESDSYFLPLGLSFDTSADKLLQESPNSILSPAISRNGRGVLHDGMLDDSACAALLSLIQHAAQISSRNGLIRGVRGTQLAAIRGRDETPLTVKRSSGEQSNSSVFYDERLILKVFRRRQAGPNPDCELGKYLTEQVHFDGTPPFVGEIEYAAADGEPAALAMLQGVVPNQGDGWKLTLEELARYYENCATASFPDDADFGSADLFELSEQPTSRLALDAVGIALDSAARLGTRTAQLHLALASGTAQEAFSAQPFSAADLQSTLSSLRQEAARVFDLLKDSVAELPDDVVDLAGMVLGRRRQILASFQFPTSDIECLQRIRVHGDYHLGQVLQVKTDYVILDFEGEPARSLADRRAKQSPLKDVAGMLRSLSYAAYAALMNYTARRPEDLQSLQPWARIWERSTGAEFLRAYRVAARGAAFLPCDPSTFRQLLATFLLDKALYELSYELNNRPTWVRIPLMGILSLPLEAGGREWHWTPSSSRS
jgi:maltose alpha-D-glucosyltransferase/alpha-amylase